MNRKVILIVEDNRDELMIYSTLLSYHGYAVLAAADFDSALDMVREEEPDLVIVDVNLGDVKRDGCDLVEAMRQASRSRRMPVIAHTAFGDVYRSRLEQVGCEQIIHKPTNPGKLLESVVRLIGPADEPPGVDATAGNAG